ncbi:hypothetical protein ACFLRF_05845, partial [Candidatus Altiarchaeota archaeon]
HMIRDARTRIVPSDEIQGLVKDIDPLVLETARKSPLERNRTYSHQQSPGVEDLLFEYPNWIPEAETIIGWSKAGLSGFNNRQGSTQASQIAPSLRCVDVRFLHHEGQKLDFPAARVLFLPFKLGQDESLAPLLGDLYVNDRKVTREEGEGIACGQG